jgi:hypothetical protein
MGGTKLMLAQGRRPQPWMSADPENREAKAGRWPSLPFQNLRTVSRYWSFHSAQPGGKLPTWYPPVPVSGARIGLTADSADPAPSRRGNRHLGVLAIRRARVRGEVEAETVDTHFLFPVAQAVHYHLRSTLGMAQLERVPVPVKSL